jgi:hypothetical protein
MPRFVLGIAVLALVGCSLAPGGATPTPGGPPLDPRLTVDMQVLGDFLTQNAPYQVHDITTTDDGFVVSMTRPHPEVEARARALISTPITFVYDRSQPRPPLRPDPSLIEVPTLGAASCGLLPLEGTLVAHEQWGIAIRESDQSMWRPGEISKVWWPEGWAGRRDGERLALVDEGRRVRAYVGDLVVIGGSPADDGEFRTCGDLRPAGSPR